MGVGSVDILNFEGLFTVGSSQRTDVVLPNGMVPVALIQPSSQLAATSIIFEAARTTSHTFYALATSSGGSYTLNTSTQAGLQYALDYTKFLGIGALKLVLGSTAGADTGKTMTLVMRPIN